MMTSLRRITVLTFSLTFFIWGSASAETKPKLPRVALVIGNAKYEAAAGALRNPRRDAKAMAATLRALGFEVTEKHNLTRDALLKAMMSFRDRLSGQEVALFYYAGHGLSVGGANYLLPIQSGYQPGQLDAAGLRLLAETRLFNAEQAVADMKTGGAVCNLVILDACRNTPLVQTGTERVVRGGGLAEMHPPAGSLIAFSTDAGAVAQDGEGENGLYTGELIKHLKTPGLTIEQVFKRTRAAVMECSDGQQVPAEYSRLIGEDIYLAGPAAVDVVKESPPPTPAAPAAEKGGAVASAGSGLISLTEIDQLAAEGQVQPCLSALFQHAQQRGGPFPEAAKPLGILLEQAKEQLKQPQLAGSALTLCEGVISCFADCLPLTHAEYKPLLAKAHNRRGDALMLYQRNVDAIAAYDAAYQLMPEDGYILYNRSRAHLALGQRDQARSDLLLAKSAGNTTAKLRTLIGRALKELDG
jgi:Caspase domain